MCLGIGTRAEGVADNGLTPAEWTMHFGGPEVPELYSMNRDCSKGSCTKDKGLPSPVDRNSDNVELECLF